MLTALVGRLWPPRCRLELLRRSPRHCRWWEPFPSGGGAGVCVGESHQLSDSLSGAGLDRDRHNKARSAGPAHLFAQPWRSSRGCGLSCSVDGSLAPGARCRAGRAVGSGAAAAVQWTASISSRNMHARNITSAQKLFEQGPDRQRAPGRCSGGLSSILGRSSG